MQIIKLICISFILLLIGCGSNEGGDEGDNDKTSSSTSITNTTDSNGNQKISIVNITIKDNIIYYNGDISEASYKIFQQTISNYNSSDISKIIINSGGGDTIYGRKIGKFIFDNKLDVQVDTMCFSSCANYIFTAGKNKIINKDSYVGWHGNEHEDFIRAKENNQSVKERLSDVNKKALLDYFKSIKKEISEEEANIIVQKQVISKKQNMLDEKEFYKYIGVNLYISILGLKEQIAQSKDGFTYSIEDMKKFNVNNVTYLGSGEYKDNIKDKILVYKVTENISDLEEFDYTLLD